jgi:hypothetical protein
MIASACKNPKQDRVRGFLSVFISIPRTKRASPSSGADARVLCPSKITKNAKIRAVYGKTPMMFLNRACIDIGRRTQEAGESVCPRGHFRKK